MSDTYLSLPSGGISQWKNVLTTRWFVSSRIVSFITLALLLVVNLPGQVEYRPALSLPYSFQSPIRLKPQYEHGWPWVYAVREAHEVFADGHIGTAYEEETIAKCWHFWNFGQNDVFRPMVLVADILMAAAIAFSTSLLFEMRRRKVGSIWRYGLLDLGIGILMISILLAWYTYADRERLREQQLEAEFEKGHLIGMILSTQQGGPTTVRLLTGDRYWKSFDRIIWVQTFGSDTDLFPRLKTLSTLRGLTADQVFSEDMPLLEGFDGIDALQLWILNHHGGTVVQEGRSVERAEIPPLKQLRALFLGHSGAMPVGLNGFPNLEVLDLTGVPVADATIGEIEALKKLRELSLAKTSFSPSALVHLATLLHLKRLILERTNVDDDSLANLSQLKSLEHLNLSFTKIHGVGLRHLQGLTRLSSLDLSDTILHDDAVDELLKFNSLEFLNIDGTSLSKSAVTKLKTALPKCTIVGPKPAPATPQSGGVY